MSNIKFINPFLTRLFEGTNSILNKTGLWASSIWAQKEQRNRAKKSYLRLAKPFVLSLEQKLNGLQDALDKFDWPADGLPWYKSTLTRADSTLQDKVKATTPHQIIPPYQYLSRGFPANRTANIPAGTYRFSLKINGREQTLSITISDGQTYAKILDTVKSAINASSLPVQAETVHHYSPYQEVDSPSLGRILAISVNQPYADQKLEIKDTKGLLLKKLGLHPVNEPIPGAKIKTYLLQGRSINSPSLYTSSGFSANREINWGIKKYTFSINVAQTTTDISIFVVDKNTWEEVQILAQDPQALVKDTADWETKVSNLTFDSSQIGDNATWASIISQLSGQGLVVFPESTYEDLLSGLARHINSSLTNVLVNVNKRDVPDYSQDKTLYTSKLFLEVNLKEPKIGQRMYLEDGNNSPLDLLGMKSTARPGSDAILNFNGHTYTSASNRFGQDRGKVNIELKKVFGQVLPLKIVQAMEEVHDRLGEVIHAYNDLLLFLRKDEDIFEKELISDWEKPANDLKTDLDWLGIQKTKEKGLLWINGDRFWQALGEDKHRVKRILLDETKGLIPKWKNMVSYMNKKGLESFLLPATAYVDHYPPWKKN